MKYVSDTYSLSRHPQTKSVGQLWNKILKKQWNDELNMFVFKITGLAITFDLYVELWMNYEKFGSYKLPKFVCDRESRALSPVGYILKENWPGFGYGNVCQL